MLRRKNVLMRAGKTEEAGALAKRVGAAIVRRNTAEFRADGADVDAKDVWDKVRQLTSHGPSRGDNSKVTAAELNEHYASISHDDQYQRPLEKLTAYEGGAPLSVWQVFNALDHLHHTATGLDDIPAWFLRLGAPFFPEPLT